jgi:hypothetical protein
VLTGLDENPETSHTSVSQNFPNPFNSLSTITVDLSKRSALFLEIFDITGQLVQSIGYGTLNAGSHELDIDATELNTGVYFYTIHAGNAKITRKMIVR